jgi:hypothetical protein
MYAESYRFAAETLVRRFADTGRDQDFLALPALFLYRHYAELALKFLERETAIFLRRPVLKLKGHTLAALWMPVLKALEEIWPNRYADENAAVGELIAQLQVADPSSDTFRYPVNVAGEANLPPEFARFDLLHFATEMQAFGHWVGGVADALNAESEAEEEMREIEREAAPREDQY